MSSKKDRSSYESEAYVIEKVSKTSLMNVRSIFEGFVVHRVSDDLNS